MALVLHFHPLSSFCWKVLIPLYENDTPFEPRAIDFADPASVAAFRQLWPIARMPVLRDMARERTVPESSIIIEYLDRHYPGPVRFLPADPDLARETRLRDRFYDLYVQVPMQKIVADRRRPAEAKDRHGVAEARALLQSAYGMIEQDMTEPPFAMDESFSLADCAAAPALYYANLVEPFEHSHPSAARYLARLMARPSFARVLAEAQPYFALFPQE